MKKQKLFALALAGATTIGTLAAGMPVMAEGQTGETTVNLTVAEVSGTFTLTVPSKTALDKDGSVVPLNDGVKVSGKNMKNSVVVTATSQNGWALKLENDDSDSESTHILYHLYNDEAGQNYFEKMEFTEDEVNDGDGTTKNVYAKVEPNLDAKAGNYSDVITFTAEATGSGSGGGEITPDEPVEDGYVQITEDNIEGLLYEDAFIYTESKEYSSYEEATEAAKRRLKKGESLFVVYGVEDDGTFKTCVANEDGTFTSIKLDYDSIINSCGFYSFYIKKE